MSSETLPITPAAFAEAIKELTLPVLYVKVAELQNSIAHLQRSNQELRAFIAESCESEADKQELQEYIAENEEVKKSMDERIRLCKAEVEGRGSTWIDLDAEPGAGAGTEGTHAQAQGQEQEPEQPAGSGSAAPAAVNGTASSTDAPSAERPNGQEDGNDGVYL
ncbi:uncharacterized protein BDV17DRAFT_47929 [Aspergillus undulatus]|uniref:uncharacterized protein n=1 Tax=Aspergillus undulatus TaxID=1810928 RepID=UPI003CCE286F